MNDSIATASRNLLQIKRRKYSYLLYRKLQNVFGAEQSSGETTTLYLHPQIDDGETAADLGNRLGWYFPEESFDQLRIFVSLADGVDIGSFDADGPDSQGSYPSAHLPIEAVTDKDVAASAADTILVWDTSRRVSPPLLKNLEKVEFVDPTYYSIIEPTTWARVSDSTRQPTENHSKEKFKQLEREAAEYDTAYIFATGPSLDRALNFEFPDDSLKIICNSIVRNDELLAHIDPDILVFSDPVFHFGPSRYAESFREDAAETLQTYDCVATLPAQQHSLFCRHYPEVSTDIIDITTDNFNEPRFPTPEDRTVMGTGNIMTVYMIPLASVLADTVYILGADGREENESYFWEHSDMGQYSDELIQTVVDSHASFFRDRIYTDYYQEHIETFADMLEYGESRGVEYYSLTESYIPCLKERTVSNPENHTGTGSRKVR